MKTAKSRNNKRNNNRGANPRESASRVIAGRNAVEMVLNHFPDKLEKILMSSEEKGRAAQILDKAREAHVNVVIVSKQELTQKAGTDSHQGVIGFTNSPAVQSRHELLATYDFFERSVFVALDGVTDPHNLGAILRACECFAVDGVIWSKNRSSGVTPVVTKVSVGASELVPLYEVSNLAEILLALQKEHGASIICADGSPQSKPIAEMPLSDHTVLVLGSEGEGVSDLVLRRADFRVQIPMLGKIDSLNVSQAAAVFLYHIKAQS